MLRRAPTASASVIDLSWRLLPRSAGDPRYHSQSTSRSGDAAERTRPLGVDAQTDGPVPEPRPDATSICRSQKSIMRSSKHSGRVAERVSAYGTPIEAGRQHHGHFLRIARVPLSGFHDSSCQAFQTGRQGSRGIRSALRV